MLGGIGDIANLLKSARQLQGNVEKMQQEMASKRFEGQAGGGMVHAVVDGRGTLIDIKIDPQAVEDVELLEDLVKAAVGSAVAHSQEQMKSELSGLAGGLNLPGLEGMLGGAMGMGGAGAAPAQPAEETPPEENKDTP
jgi:DNA-binding YbaB/EbfC family protein